MRGAIVRFAPHPFPLPRGERVKVPNSSYFVMQPDRRKLKQGGFPLRLRALSAFISVLFLWDTVAWSAPLSAFTLTGNSSLVRELRIPESLGSITSRYPPSRGQSPGGAGSDAPVIIHIQDAHSQPEAQKNIQAILEYLSKKKQINAIAVEGAFGKIDPGILNIFPQQGANLATAEYLVEQGEHPE